MLTNQYLAVHSSLHSSPWFYAGTWIWCLGVQPKGLKFREPCLTRGFDWPIFFAEIEWCSTHSLARGVNQDIETTIALQVEQMWRGAILWSLGSLWGQLFAHHISSSSTFGSKHKLIFLSYSTHMQQTSYCSRVLVSFSTIPSNVDCAMTNLSYKPFFRAMIVKWPSDPWDGF